MPVSFVIAALVASANTDWREVILFTSVVVPLIAVTVYGAYRALASHHPAAGAAILCGWAFPIGRLIAVVYLVAIDRPARARGESHGTGVGYANPSVADKRAL
jgi:hypothetical protein